MDPKEREERELKNIRNKIIEYIRKADFITTVRLALITGVKIPKQILIKFLSKSSGQ